jgi:IS1 family transposase
MNQLPLEKRVQILQMLCEGSSMRSISRIVDVSINTVTKLLVEAGTACAAYHDANVKGLHSRRVQCNEIWSFCYAKAKNASATGKLEAGDVWTWTALDGDSNLIVSYTMGGRDSDSAIELMDDLRKRIDNRVQLTTDGHKAYLEAVEGAFGSDVDYGMLVKVYGPCPEAAKGKYSPAECLGAHKHKGHISTSFVERQNFNMRMGMRRFTRLTNGFSKKLENHFHALALYFQFYNYCRIHKSLRVTPAMRAGVSKKIWEIGDILALIPN